MQFFIGNVGYVLTLRNLAHPAAWRSVGRIFVIQSVPTAFSLMQYLRCVEACSCTLCSTLYIYIYSVLHIYIYICCKIGEDTAIQEVHRPHMSP
jgi:hypothetical protein